MTCYIFHTGYITPIHTVQDIKSNRQTNKQTPHYTNRNECTSSQLSQNMFTVNKVMPLLLLQLCGTVWMAGVCGSCHQYAKNNRKQQTGRLEEDNSASRSNKRKQQIIFKTWKIPHLECGNSRGVNSLIILVFLNGALKVCKSVRIVHNEVLYGWMDGWLINFTFIDS